ncbi:efflux transporter periplasmic adaptor subunit [Longimonas halophila]|uniref:Efflux transporter periplasmic adaptor subunit n=1 Tax=Longimonas halophila TaxID=1469170 RepID=A0A2H3NJN8_9BACT|nr:efflux transporter periplasmic adaptor subunit [Longimonas halophila]
MAAGCSSEGGGNAERPGGMAGDREPPSVEAVLSEFGGLPLEARVSGTVQARNQVQVYPEVSERVTNVYAESGDYVEEGEPLVQLNDRSYRDRLRQAEASLRVAQADVRAARATLSEAEARLARTERLVEQEFESTQTLEGVQAEVESAEAAVDQAEGQVAQAEATVQERRAEVEETVVRAPFSGYVGERNVQVGQRVETSAALFTLADLGRVRVQVPISDRIYSQIRAGQTVEILPGGDENNPVRAQVSRISPFLDSDSYSARAEIDVENSEQRLLPGMFVQVDIFYGESEQATLIPRSALYDNPRTGETGVFVASALGEEMSIETTSDQGDSSDARPALTEPTPMQFQAVEVIAEGSEVAGVRGIDSGTWVITVGQELLMERGGDVDARVRAMDWERIMSLQRLQDQDVLQDFLERQQRMARERFSGENDVPTDSATDEQQPSSSSMRTVRSSSTTPAG